jgi:hypothetical protein
MFYTLEVTLASGELKIFKLPHCSTWGLAQYKREASKKFDVPLDDCIIYIDGGAIL